MSTLEYKNHRRPAACRSVRACQYLGGTLCMKDWVPLIRVASLWFAANSTIKVSTLVSPTRRRVGIKLAEPLEAREPASSGLHCMTSAHTCADTPSHTTNRAHAYCFFVCGCLGEPFQGNLVRLQKSEIFLLPCRFKGVERDR